MQPHPPPSPPPPPAPPPSPHFFLDATVRLQYLRGIRLAATCPTRELLQLRTGLSHLLHQQPVANDPQCQHALYAATLLATVIDLLGSRRHRPADSDGSSLPENPLEWTAVRILIAPDGEQRLPLVMRIYDRRYAGADVRAPRRQLLLRTVDAIAADRLDQARRTDAQQLLDRVRQLDDVRQMQAAVERIVRLQRNPARQCGLRVATILQMLLTPSTDLARYQAAGLVYARFVQVLVEEPGVFGEFVRQLVPDLDRPERADRFQQCLRFRRFYDALLVRLRQLLAAVRVMACDGDEEDDWVLHVAAGSETGDDGDDDDGGRLSAIPVRDLRRIVCCVLHGNSPVRRKFASDLREMELPEVVFEFVTQVTMY